MNEQYTLLIADDHPIFRSGIHQILSKDPSLAVIAESEDGEDAFRKMTEVKPDAAILDINMPKMSGLDIARRISAVNSPTRIILLTMLDDKKIFIDAMDAGVEGYVLKDSAASEILRAIDAVRHGRRYLSPTLAEVLLKRNSMKRESTVVSLKDLTPTETRVLRYVSELKTNQEIAEELFISKRTVENHRTNIARKLSLQDSNAVLKFALQHKNDFEVNE